MATFDYSELLGVASSLLTEFGTTAAIRRTTNSSGSTPWDPTQTTADTTVRVAFVDLMSDRVNGVAVDEPQAQRNVQERLEGYLDAADLGIVPTPADTLVYGGKVYQLNRMQPVAPGGVTVVYEFSAWR